MAIQQRNDHITHQINALVETFYRHLLEEQYFSEMFEKRQVNIEVLKERQRVFIMSLVSDGENGEEEVSQVQTRHPFQTTPERAKIWLQIMKESMIEEQFDEELQQHLLQKMKRLMTSIVKEKE
ncbi:protoglobin domain-containing protein [Bacillus solimangrovi]|uniref:Globin-sensor domain-containing protein n=1 Tax=Bacillus solimangrovi TaxID=1305675 RepID=A0A1E5LIA7_9BACI|nr:protoglobin domain-containing protein [Bacillus solimangrovi]OEH93801.1 hypothetical protein BFG57_11505 [Bacillus solimangrovi]